MKAVKFIFIFSQKTKKPSNRKAFKVPGFKIEVQH